MKDSKILPIVHECDKRIHSFFLIFTKRSDMQPCDTTQLYLTRRTEASLNSKTL